jgi:hypothetical protein
MKTQDVTTRSGEQLTLHQVSSGKWCCPVCGSPELGQPPYFTGGGASFEMCSCGFEFGFDDDPGASAGAFPSVTSNLERWRASLVAKTRNSPEQWGKLQAQLKFIGVSNV